MNWFEGLFNCSLHESTATDYALSDSGSAFSDPSWHNGFGVSSDYSCSITHDSCDMSSPHYIWSTPGVCDE